MVPIPATAFQPLQSNSLWHVDFGLPSTHSLNAVTMPWFLIWAMWDRLGDYHVVCVVFAAFFSISMFFSRQYLAAHSPADVITGIILGIPCLFIWMAVCDDYDRFIRLSFYSPAVTLAVAFLVISLHPRASRPSPSHRYSCALMGLASGGILGVWALNHWGKSTMLELFQEWPSVPAWISANVPAPWQTVAQYSFNAHFGIILMFAAYALVKVASFILLGVLFDAAGVSPLFKTLQTSFGRMALPHSLALDNLDHPQFKKEKEGHDSSIPSAKQSAKLISEFTSALAVGFCNSYITPVILYCLGCVTESFLTY